MSFSISKDDLIEIVTATQKRVFAEEVEIFETKVAPNDWLASGSLNTYLRTELRHEGRNIWR